MLVFLVTGLPLNASATGTVCGITLTPGLLTGFETAATQNWTWAGTSTWTYSTGDKATGSYSLHHPAAMPSGLSVDPAKSPRLGVPTGATLSFAYRFYGSGSVNVYFNPYPADPYDWRDPMLALAAGGASSAWTTVTHSMAYYQQTSGVLVFEYAGNSASGGDGFWLDDVKIDSTPSASGDSTAPVMTSVSTNQPDAATNVYSGAPTARAGFSASDDLAGVYGYSWDLNLAWPPLDDCADVLVQFWDRAPSAQFSIPNGAWGTYTVRAKPIDWNANVGSAMTTSFKVDRIIPAVTFTDPSAGETGVAPSEPIQVFYNDMDSGNDEFQTATKVDVSSVHLFVDGMDVIARDKQVCAVLTAPTQTYQDEVYAAIREIYDENTDGDIRTPVLWVTFSPWATQMLQTGDSVVDAAGLDSVASVIGNVCAGAVITPDSLTYTPIAPWAAGSHTARIEFKDTAYGVANTKIHQWTFTVVA